MVVILREIDGAKEIGMTTVLSFQTLTVMKPTLKLVVLMTYLILSFQKFDPVRHKKTNGRQWDPYAR